MNRSSYLTPYANINSKWITDLKVKIITKKPLGGKNIREYLCSFGLARPRFLRQDTKNTIHTGKKFCFSKDIVKK